MIKILVIATIVIYLAINAIVAKYLTAAEMHKSFIKGQCLVGKVCANIFYAPAWFLKGLKAVVFAIIA